MFLNLVEIAESFGVSERVVQGWVRDEGLPCMEDRGRQLFDRAQVADWAARRGLAAKAGFLAPEVRALATGLQLTPLLRTGGIWRDVPGAEVAATLGRIVSALPGVTPPVRQMLARRLQAAGGLTTAPVGGGIAMPHPSTRVALGRDAGVVALILLRDALPLTEPAPDGVPVTRLVFFIAPTPRLHLDLLARLSRAVARGPFREALLRGAAAAEIFRALDAAEASAGSATKPASPVR